MAKGRSSYYSDSDNDDDIFSSSSNSRPMKKISPIQQQQMSKPAQPHFQDLYCNSNTWSSSNYSRTNIVNSKKVQENQLSSITGHPNSKEVVLKLPLNEWLAYLKENSDKESMIPFSIERASYKGQVEDFNVSFKCNFEITVFQQQPNVNTISQVQIPLLPSTVCIASSTIHYSKDNNDNNSNNNNKVDEESCVGLHQDAHSLFCDRAGYYIVELNVLANFLTPKKNGVGLAIPKSTFNQLEIKVPRKVNIDVVEPTVRDNPLHLKYERVAEYTHSIKACPFQPTNYLKIQWTDVEGAQQPTSQKMINQIDLSSSTGSNEKAKAAAAMQLDIKPIEATKLNVEQNTLCSVGEGVIMITSTLSYTIVSGSASSFDILVGSNIKVLGVEGANIKRWECTSPQLVEIGTPEPNKDQLIKVQLTSSVETTYRLVIQAEIEMSSTSATVFIPKGIRCSGAEISREKGYLAVESTANVEVEQLSRENLTLIDKSELPSSLEQLSSGPLLLSYKFLVPKYSLTFKVVKHQDLSVLVAFCPNAHYIATCSSEGAMLTKCVFTIRNEQQQYVRVTIPHQFEIWSTIVASRAVKPAIDDQGCLMIPLNKSSGAGGIQKTFNVELVYKHTNDFEFSESGNGTFSTVFPRIDIPIATLQISLYLPTSYQYGQFTGGAKEISRFATQPVSQSVNDDDDGQLDNVYVSNVNPIMQVQSQQIAMPQMNSNIGGFERASFGGGAPGGSTLKDDSSGLKPVKVTIPLFGKTFSFEQLLVISTQIDLSTTYSTKRSMCEIL